jgi:hypothetical protein
MLKLRIFILLTLCLLQTGCLSALFGTNTAPSANYQLPSPGASWEMIDPGAADTAYRNSRDNSILNVNSMCGEARYQTLESVATDILKQLPEQKVIEEPMPVTIGGNPGLTTEVEGTVDGKALTVRLAVIRTSNCLFDIILAGSTLTPESRAAFARTLQNFRERDRL